MPTELPQKTEEIAGYASALRALVDRDFLYSQDHQEQVWRCPRDGVHPDILLFEEKFRRRMEKLGVPVYPHNMLRSPAEQTELFIKGVSRARAGQSAHNYGMAVDIVHSVKHWDIPRECWTLLGHIGAEVAKQNSLHLVWGGSFKKIYDPAHWEIENWRSLKELTTVPW